jgi:hypothetical protein
MINREKTCTTDDFTFQNIISAAQTLEIVYENAFPWLWETQQIYNIFNYFQHWRGTASIYEQQITQKSGNIHHPFSI